MGAQCMTGTRRLTELATTMLQFRFSEKQTEALIQQAKTSEQLLTTTHDLGRVHSCPCAGDLGIVVLLTIVRVFFSQLASSDDTLVVIRFGAISVAAGARYGLHESRPLTFRLR